MEKINKCIVMIKIFKNGVTLITCQQFEEKGKDSFADCGEFDLTIKFFDSHPEAIKFIKDSL